MNTYAVDPHTLRIYVKTGEVTETFDFKTKRQADKKIMSLNAAGYKFDPMMWAIEIEPTNDAEDRYNRGGW